jgi:hypothetical protein
LFFTANLSAQSRGLLIQKEAGLDSVVGKQWAVFIAIDRYREWAPLKNPVKDAKEIRDILLAQYYIDEVRELYDQNATAAGIRQLFSGLRSQTGRDDSVFVFYAGHGHTDDLTNTGSWIPSDGGRDRMAQANWLPNIQIRNMLAALPAKHVFLISDSCFSGDMLDVSRGAGPLIDSDYYRRVYSRVSRQVMTSGASEEVPDASEFALRLKSSFRRAEGACIDPQYLFTIVREVRSTQPMLGTIKGSEHQEGGSFLFFRKLPAGAAVPVETQQTVPELTASASLGAIKVASQYAGMILLDGIESGSRIKAGGTVTITNITSGLTEVAIKADDGSITKASDAVMVQQGRTANAVIGNPVPETKKPQSSSNPAAKFYTIGAAVGSAFADPFFIATVQGTIALLPYSFLHIGLDYGLASGLKDVGYYSLYPFAHAALFLPFKSSGGCYFGAGGGYLVSEYSFPEGAVPLNFGAMDFITGLNFLDKLDISYTLRTNFSVASNKISVGYVFRF